MHWSSRILLTWLVVGSLGCTISRWYIGSPVRDDPAQVLAIGETEKSEVLARFGPPDRILRQHEGDVFIYRYDQHNGSEFRIGTPPFAGVFALTLFQWEKVQDKSDRLRVFFDPTGVVSAFGFRHGRAELEPL
jgi:hypothetical protein